MTLYAEVIIDIPTRAFDSAFTYSVPEPLRAGIQVGCCVLVDFASRPVLAYVMALCEKPDDKIDPGKIKPLREILSESLFDSVSTNYIFINCFIVIGCAL